MLALFRLLLLSITLFGTTVALAAEFVDDTREACAELCAQGDAGERGEHVEPQADCENIPLLLMSPRLMVETPAGVVPWVPIARASHIPPPATPPPRRG